VLTIAVTGGIGSGKSTASAVLAELGAVVVDSDRLARDVVAPGTPGLEQVFDEFGPEVRTPEGALDRSALAGIVFADQDARRKLEAITHPLVRAAFERERDHAAPDAIVVNDVPLLRSVSMAAGFHLVITIGAPADLRLRRLITRGLSEADARARIAAQISDDQRLALSDIWLANNTMPDHLREAVTTTWSSRLLPFAANLSAGRRASRGAAVLQDPDPDWARLAALLGARISAAAGGLRVEHIGSTSVPGLPAKDVIDLQLVVPDLQVADRLAAPLTAAGFPLVPGIDQDNPHPIPGEPDSTDPARWRKRVHANADPGRSVNLHLRVRNAPNRRESLLFRDWLRADDVVRAEYLELKRELAGRFAGDPDVTRYAEAKEPWFDAAFPRAEVWARRTGWVLPG
jgi:dephospho-CoA kinase